MFTRILPITSQYLIKGHHYRSPAGILASLLSKRFRATAVGSTLYLSCGGTGGMFLGRGGLWRNQQVVPRSQLPLIPLFRHNMPSSNGKTCLRMQQPVQRMPLRYAIHRGVGSFILQPCWWCDHSKNCQFLGSSSVNISP